MTHPLPIRIALADDHQLFCQALDSLLSPYPEQLQVVFAAYDGKQLLQQLDLHAVDVVLLDILMPQLSGMDAISLIKEKHPNVKIVMLTTVTHPQTLLETIQRGADGFLSKQADQEELLQAIEAVYQGEPYYGKKYERLLSDLAISCMPPADVLTAREQEITSLCASGLSSKEMAECLNISTRTADTHKTSIFKKLNIHNSVELVHYALIHGLISL